MQQGPEFGGNIQFLQIARRTDITTPLRSSSTYDAPGQALLARVGRLGKSDHVRCYYQPLLSFVGSHLNLQEPGCYMKGVRSNGNLSNRAFGWDDYA